MRTYLWLTAVALAAAGMTGLAGVASAEHPTYCEQQLEYPPVCCAYLAFVHPGVRSVYDAAKCDWVP